MAMKLIRGYAFFFNKTKLTIVLECRNFHVYESKYFSVGSIRREMECRRIRHLNNSLTQEEKVKASLEDTEDLIK